MVVFVLQSDYYMYYKYSSTSELFILLTDLKIGVFILLYYRLAKPYGNHLISPINIDYSRSDLKIYNIIFKTQSCNIHLYINRM